MASASFAAGTSTVTVFGGEAPHNINDHASTSGEGLIVSGPRRGKQFTYMLLDERVPAVAPISQDEALFRLTRAEAPALASSSFRPMPW